MISDIGRWNRCARPSSSCMTTVKCLALKRPVFGSTRASAWSCGIARLRWMRRSGATAKGISHGFRCQKAATASPRVARMKSVERLSNEKTPASRSEWPRASVTIGARITWFAATAIVQAASPASAQRRCSSGMRPFECRISAAPPQVARFPSV